MQFNVKKIVVLGGGTAGWSAAALLARQFQPSAVEIVLIESPNITPIGVGEATVPAILNVHNHLQIDEREFLKATQATFKLGIEFRDWRSVGQDFFHPFSNFGVPIEGVDFHQCWLRLNQAGKRTNLQDYSLCTALAKAGRFAIPDNESPNSLAWYGYAYHFDASLYAQFLRDYSEKRGVRRLADTVVGVDKDPQTHFVKSLALESGESLAADFFIDCSGFNSLLLEGQYQVGYEDWSHWLPCNRAWAVQTESDGELLPYTTSTAMSAGWRWRIPLQNRTGNGYVYSSAFTDDDRARTEFLETLQEPMITEPRLIQFTAGMRPNFWVNNVAAVGLSSGFIEPLESTSISLMHTGIGKIIAHMPELVVTDAAIAHANEQNRMEYERIRDFIILHYWASQRDDTDFWRSVRSTPLPDKLEAKIQQFLRDGSMLSYEQESFRDPSWLAMYNGFGLNPAACSEAAEKLSPDMIENIFEKIGSAIVKGVDQAPSQQEFLKTL